MADFNLGIREAAAKNIYGAPKASGIREEGQKITGDLEQSVVSLKTEGLTQKSLINIAEQIVALPGKFTETFDKLKNEGLVGTKKTIQEATANASNVYGGVGGVQTIKKEDVSVGYLDKLIDPEYLKQTQTNNVNIENRTTVDLTNTDGSLKSLTESQKSEIIQILTEKFKNDPDMQLVIVDTVKKWNNMQN